MFPSIKISVITVAYNSATTIADTLRSVSGQTYQNIEHLIIDGASTDDTLAVIRTDGAHVATLISEGDHGIYDAMNKGLRLATGEFVGFLNADDTFADENSVKRIVDAAGDSVDAIYGDLLYVRKDRPNEIVRYWHSGEFRRSRLRYGWMPPHPTLYVRRARIAEIGPFDLRLHIAADYEFILRYLFRTAFRVAYVPHVLVRMRTGGASNGSFAALYQKSREDLLALRTNKVGGLFSLICKNVRKLPQFFKRAHTA